jgi:hypothetical protein
MMTVAEPSTGARERARRQSAKKEKTMTVVVAEM